MSALLRSFRLLAIGSVAAVSVLAAGCGGGEPGQADVLTTTLEVAALARAVTGDALSVRAIVGTGVDPHDYSPSAQDVKRIGQATIVLRNGLGIDEFLDGALEGSGAKQVVTVTEGVQVRQGRDEQGRDEPDPHVWHDPMNDKIMVANIVRALAQAFPEHADTLRKNGEAYQARLDAVDVEIRQLIAGIPEANRKIVTNHDAFGYFIDRYGLRFVGAVIPSVSTQGEASAREVADLQNTIRREGVKAIFAESSVDPKVARAIAQDTGVKIVDDLYGDSLGEPGSGAETVDGMLLANARKIAEALR